MERRSTRMEWRRLERSELLLDSILRDFEILGSVTSDRWSISVSNHNVEDNEVRGTAEPSYFCCLLSRGEQTQGGDYPQD